MTENARTKIGRLTEAQRKALLQLSINNFISPMALKSKRAMAVLFSLQDKGLISVNLTDGAAELTAEGVKLIEPRRM